MGFVTLKSCRDKTELSMPMDRYPKQVSMPEYRYPKQLYSQEWNIKPRKDRQRKTLGRVVDDLFVALGIDKGECLQGGSSAASFLLV